MIKGLLIVIGVPLALTVFCFFVMPVLWRHGSSAAFEFGGLIILLTVGSWYGAYKLLRPGKS